MSTSRWCVHVILPYQDNPLPVDIAHQNRLPSAACKQHSLLDHNQPTTQAAVSSTKEACEEANARAKEKSDEKWRGVLREHLNKAAEEAAAVAAAVSEEHDAVLEETQQAFRM